MMGRCARCSGLRLRARGLQLTTSALPDLVTCQGALGGGRMNLSHRERGGAANFVSP